MNLGAQKYCAQGKGFQVVRAASQYAFEKFSKYFNCAIQGQFSLAFFGIWLPPKPSVLQEPRVFLIQCLSLIKLKHMPARYWLLILSVS